MLFGQWEDENDRERKMIKSKMYKEMLDNQIIINEKYKKQHDLSRQHRDQSKVIQKKFIPSLEYRKHDFSITQPDAGEQYVRKKNKAVNLPVLRDRNTYIQGVSRFIKVETKVDKPSKKGQVKTEIIEEDDDLDEYNSTCEQIIRELQSINKQSPNMKYRRKLYEYSGLAPNKKRYEKTKIQQLQKSQVQLYNNYDYIKPIKPNHKKQPQINPFEQSVRSKFGSQDRVPSYSMINSTKHASHQNDISSKSFKNNSESTKSKIQKIKIRQEENPANEFEQERLKENSLMTPKAVTQPAEEDNSNIQTKSNNLDRSRIRSNIELTKYPPISAPSQKQQQPNVSHLKLQKQNFIDLLRKVKNRGESLFIKLSAFPIKHEMKDDK